MRTLLAAITLFVTFAVGCGGGNGTSGTNPPLAQGAWEFALSLAIPVALLHRFQTATSQ